MLNDGCPTQDQTVSLLESKDSNKARWEAQMFRFVDEKEMFYFLCDRVEQIEDKAATCAAQGRLESGCLAVIVTLDLKYKNTFR